MQWTLPTFTTTSGKCLLSPSPSRVSVVEERSRFMVPARTSSASSSRRHVMPLRLRLRSQLTGKVSPCADSIPTRNPYGSSLQRIQDLKERINSTIKNLTLSNSPFDTAWVAMVPSPHSHLQPCFPECLEWISKNQKLDGSWTINQTHTYLMKDALSSTLACIIALKKWDTRDDLVERGLDFIRKNSAYAIDESQLSPIGFNIIFTRMIEHGKQLGLNIPIEESILGTMLSKCDNELKRIPDLSQQEAYLAYIAEGYVQDYNLLKRYQGKNGSLFNSPSATAAMLTQIHDVKAMEYLHSVVDKFKGSIPVIYPMDLYAHLLMVDSFEKLGISYHFSDYIENIIHQTYSAWKQNEDELFSDISMYAMAFRLLRMHGYDISLGLTSMDGEQLIRHKLNNYPQNVTTVLELYKASQVHIYEDEIYMEKLTCWSHQFLEKSLSNYAAQNDFEKNLAHKVDYNLKSPLFKNLQRLEHRMNIETYDVNGVECLKASYMIQNVHREDIFNLAREDFNICQSMHQDEFHLFQRWVKEVKLDQILRVDLNRIVYCYFSAAALLFPPELFEARMSWAKNCLLVTVVDEFFDSFGSMEEHDNFVDLCRRWDPDYKNYCCSSQVYFLFDAIYSTINELSIKASSIHGYPVTRHFIQLWVDLINAMNKEAEWQRNRTVPTVEQYMTYGTITSGVGPMVVLSLYFLGPKLSEDIFKSQEFLQLYKSTGICGRLINDLEGHEREVKDRKLNSVSLKAQNEMISEKDAKKDLWKVCDDNRAMILKLVLRRNGTVVPRACKELFWKLCSINYFFYSQSDGYRKGDFVAAINAVINDPI